MNDTHIVSRTILCFRSPGNHWPYKGLPIIRGETQVRVNHQIRGPPIVMISAIPEALIQKQCVAMKTISEEAVEYATCEGKVEHVMSATKRTNCLLK